MRFLKRLFFLFCILFSGYLAAQQPKRYTAVDIFEKLEKLNILGNVLYIAAHPDDENTRMITYLSNSSKVNAAYLSLTRGDGGQNSIGPEQSELLGVLRTQELLSARKVDGGQQFFTRAMDFGYSKSSEEALQIWSREDLLFDMVWVIRNFRPDVIINRFPADPRAGHGQHEASALLSAEAFEMAADPKVFKEQLQFVSTWKPTRLFLNTGRWWNPDMQEGDSVISVDIGEYEPLIGLSYSELGADSRSRHRSQAFGVTWTRGESKELLEILKGPVPANNMFEGIDLSWNRLGKASIGQEIGKIINEYSFEHPAKSIPALISVRGQVEKVSDQFWRNIKLKEIDEIIKACLGLYIEARSNMAYASGGDSLEITFEFTNRSEVPVILESITSRQIKINESYAQVLANNDRQNITIHKIVPEGIPYSSPYWLDNPRDNYQYVISDLSKNGLAENGPSVFFDAKLKVLNQELTYKIPLVYTWTDRMAGQQYEPFETGPALYVDIKNGVYIFPDDKPKRMEVSLASMNQSIEGEVFLDIPDGWRTEPQSIPFKVASGEAMLVEFMVYPGKDSQKTTIKAIARSGQRIFDKKMVRIEYPHFPKQLVNLPSEATVVKLDIQKKGNRIAYFIGAGDEVGQSLEQVGYEVTYVSESNIGNLNLNDFDAIVFGIMAFNNDAYLEPFTDQFKEFVKQGGVMVVQYNNMRIGMKSTIPNPYPIEFSGNSSRVRVSVEDAPVRLLLSQHAVLNMPNKIGPDDFEGWIQERGLYFPVGWDDRYDAIISSNDPGEEPLDGGLLVAQYGEGYYVYTSYSWFRQLPAGVPGSFRIFANLLSLGKQ